MNQYHELRLRQFAGRRLRYVTESHRQWVELAGWQTGVDLGQLRDPWLGWSPHLQGRRLHWSANNTRFLLLPAAQACP